MMDSPEKLEEDLVYALTIWGEARGEDELGQIAVAWVIRNRVEQPCWWGRTIKEVCLKPFQFSCWNRNDPNRKKLLAIETQSDPIFLQCREIAGRVLAGTVDDPTRGATHYVNPAIAQPEWLKSLEETVRIGKHLFLKQKS